MAKTNPKALFRAKVHVRLKPGVLDPQGITLKQALSAMGYRGVADVRVGKLVEIVLSGRTRKAIEKDIKEISDRLLANPVIETFSYDIERT